MNIYLKYDNKCYTYNDIINIIKQEYDKVLKNSKYVDAYNIADNLAIGFAFKKLGISDVNELCHGSNEMKEMFNEIRNNLRIGAIGK